VNVIHEIRGAISRDSLLEFTAAEFSTQCEAAYNSLGVMFDLHCSFARVGWYSIYDCSSRYVRFIGQRYQSGIAT
jgi:hypothetical protein